MNGLKNDYTATEGLMGLISALNNNPAAGTGIKVLLDISRNLLGPTVPKALVTYNIDLQNNLFGSYPNYEDTAPSIIFAIAFLMIGLLHLVLFLNNNSRGHYFWLTAIWIMYSLMRAVGWIMRAVWATDITNVAVGLAGEVFLIIPSIILVSSNLILAHRLFTWRHPVGGSRRLFWNTMLVLYSVVLIVIAITIMASFVPYLYFLTESAYKSYQRVVQASAILIILYSLTAVSLISLAYFFKPTSKDENLYTYQPWWIESFHPLYFVQPHAAQKAEETFMKRNHNHRHAIRVIAATHHHYNMVEGLTNQRGDLKHNVSLMIICLTTLFILIGAIGRAIAVFQGKYQKDSGPICKPVVMYICWGLFEVIINLLYIVGRVDLRFYRPDVLPAKVRSIITADQSYNPSEIEIDIEKDIPVPLHDESLDFKPVTKYKNIDDNDSEFNF